MVGCTNNMWYEVCDVEVCRVTKDYISLGVVQSTELNIPRRIVDWAVAIDALDYVDEFPHTKGRAPL